MNLLLASDFFSQYGLLIILVVLIAVMIIPTMIRNKKDGAKRTEMMNSLKNGDRIITTAGVFGRIISARETTIGKVYVIETGEGKNVSYQEIHADAIMGIDTKRDIVLDAEGNDITFADEDKTSDDKKDETDTTATESNNADEQNVEVKTSKSKKTSKKNTK